MKIRVAENDSRKIYKAVTVSRLQRIQNIHNNIPKFIIQNESDQNSIVYSDFNIVGAWSGR